MHTDTSFSTVCNAPLHDAYAAFAHRLTQRYKIGDHLEIKSIAELEKRLGMIPGMHVKRCTGALEISKVGFELFGSIVIG